MIDYDAAEALLPPDVTDWKTLLAETATWLVDDGHRDWAEDPLNLAIYAALKYEHAEMKAGRPKPDSTWRLAMAQEFWRTRYPAPGADPVIAKPAPELKVNWGLVQEHSFKLVLSAQERFAKQANGDTRAAAALTLAWAMLEGRPE